MSSVFASLPVRSVRSVRTGRSGLSGLRGCTILLALATPGWIACSALPPMPALALRPASAPAGALLGDGSGIPAALLFPAALPPDAEVLREGGDETYSVVVSNVPVAELLFALARDARLNVDIHPGIIGTVSLNAIDQTLQQLLERIARQADVRWQLDGPNLSVMPDTPFLRTYRVDYVNLQRDATGSTAVTTQLAGSGAGAATGGNNSQTRIDNLAHNRFWETIERNLRDILRESDKLLPEGSSETVVERSEQQASSGTGSLAGADAARAGHARSTALHAASAQSVLAASANPATLQQAGSTVVRRATFREAAAVISNPEAGVLSIRATSRQHEKVQEFIDQVTTRAQRQVLIEAAIVEVELNDGYQQGIDWSVVPLGAKGFSLKQRAAGGISAPTSSLFELGYLNPTSRIGNLSASVRLLETFGRAKVLSSPKLSVLNNQTAVLKVVDNSVYFSIKAEVTPAVQGAQPLVAYSTTLNTVPVGLVMNVTPQINDSDSVLLNVRPSVSRIVATVADPNPDLARANVANLVPVIRVREMDSVLRIDDGNIAVLGGLMEDTLSKADSRVPGLASLPGVGAMFQDRDDSRRKTELVIFLRATVLRDGDFAGDYGAAAAALAAHASGPEARP